MTIPIRLTNLPEQPVVWQCLYHALSDFGQNLSKRSEYTFEIPDGEVTVFVQRCPNEFKVSWRYG